MLVIIITLISEINSELLIKKCSFTEGDKHDGICCLNFRMSPFMLPVTPPVDACLYISKHKCCHWDFFLFQSGVIKATCWIKFSVFSWLSHSWRWTHYFFCLCEETLATLKCKNLQSHIELERKNSTFVTPLRFIDKCYKKTATNFTYFVPDFSSKHQTHQFAWPVQTQTCCPQCCSSTSSAWTGTGTPWCLSWLHLRCRSCGPGTAGTASSGPANRTAAQERLAAWRFELSPLFDYFRLRVQRRNWQEVHFFRSFWWCWCCRATKGPKEAPILDVQWG